MWACGFSWGMPCGTIWATAPQGFTRAGSISATFPHCVCVCVMALCVLAAPSWMLLICTIYVFIQLLIYSIVSLRLCRTSSVHALLIDSRLCLRLFAILWYRASTVPLLETDCFKLISLNAHGVTCAFNFPSASNISRDLAMH